MKKIYYLMKLSQASPLRIGNGRSEETDSDLMLDGRGLPFIPGTSLAGVIRHRAEELIKDKETLNHLFGVVVPSKSKGKEELIQSSAILIGDAVLSKSVSKNDVVIGRRDGVGLGQWETALGKSKFDFQIAETKRVFYSVIEWTGNEEDYKKQIEEIIDPIMRHYVAAGLTIGARTSRGYGRFTVEVKKKSFDFLNNPEKLKEWIGFNPYNVKEFDSEETLEGESVTTDNIIEINIKMRTPFSVRVRTARTEIMEDGSVPDAVPMENIKGMPVIPGTAWAGAFRHHMHSLLRDIGIQEEDVEMKQLDAIFGMDGNGQSKISFSETGIEIENDSEQKMSVMRTAIDRFTAKPRNAALFTSVVYTGGRGTLYITFDKELPNKVRQLIAACICDMNLGLLTIGGEASVGRGLISVQDLKYNGDDITEKMTASQEGAPLNWLKEEGRNA